MHYKNDHSTLKHTLRQARTSPVLFLFLLALIISRSNPSTLPLLSPPRPHEHLEDFKHRGRTKIITIYSDGNISPEAVLDVAESELLDRFLSGVKTVAAISLALNYPTLASVTHSLVNSYKNLLAIALETEVSFPEAEAIKDRLANPDAYASAALAADEASGGGAVEKTEEKAPEAEEDSDDDMGFGLFD